MAKISIAIFGVNGYLGKHFIEAIESGRYDDKVEFPIKAIQYIAKVLPDDTIQSISQVLSGIDVVLELLSHTDELFKLMEKFVSIVRPKIFIPSQFGFDISQVDTYAPGYYPQKKLHSERIRSLGIKTVDVFTSFWAVPGDFLYETVGFAGIDPESNTITERGDPHSLFGISKLEDVANSVLILVTLDISLIPDTFKIHSDIVSFHDIIDRYESTHNVKLQVVKRMTKEEAAADLKERLARGFDFQDINLYLQTIGTQGLDRGAYSSELHNELVNPKETLWKWGKY
ncbi:CIP1 protein [Scheffersomyces xylosifermentans]|uniref:CIP1 protein n=1 Tax=Scheffersomyces xylosifermentans TaxID=1304137 RepID=UPI00315C5010